MCRGTPLFLLVSKTTAIFLPRRLLLIFFVLVIPLLLDDTRRVMESWGPSGKFDPFDNVYEVNIASHLLLLYILTAIFTFQLLFQLTIRSLSCTEISDDPVLVARLKKLYDILDVGTTPTTVLVPWLPTPAMIKKIWATKGIYEIVIKAIKNRENSGISQEDTLQMLLDTGDEKLVLVGVSFFLLSSNIS